jgi:GT2 family glycosyltransferase
MSGVSVVIPNWNGRPLLAEFLPSVIAAAKYYQTRSGAETEIIIVDDSSTDDSVAWLSQRYGPALRVIAREQNGGFARAANTGFAAARFPTVLLLNNDIKIELDAIAPLVAHFGQERVFAVCCKAYRLGTDLFDGAGKLGRFERGYWRVFLSYDILPSRLPAHTQPFYSFVASGGYAAFDRTKLQDLGGFCEMLSPFYWEDVDLCYRAWKRGWTIHYEPTSVVYHKSSATIGQKFKPRHIQVVAERNRLLMHWMNLHDSRWLAMHLVWLAIKLSGAAFSLDGVMWSAFLGALARLPGALRVRRRERARSVRSDREIDALFAQLASSEWAMVIRNVQDYYKYVELTAKNTKNTKIAKT